MCRINGEYVHLDGVTNKSDGSNQIRTPEGSQQLAGVVYAADARGIVAAVIMHDSARHSPRHSK